MHMHKKHTESIKNEEHKISTKNAQKLNEACEIPDAMIQTEKVKNCDGHHNEVWHGVQIASEIIVRNILEAKIETEIEREKVCYEKYSHIGSHKQYSVEYPRLP